MTDPDPNPDPSHHQGPSSSPRPPAYTGPFLFVNKNATNLRTREREELFAVRSHTMQVARRSRKSTTAESGHLSGQKGVHDEAGGSHTRALEDSDHEEVTEGDVVKAGAGRQRKAGSPKPKGGTSGDSHARLPSPSSSQRSGHLPHGAFAPLYPEHRSQAAAALSGSSTVQLLPAQHLAFLSQYLMGQGPTALVGNGSSDPFSAAALPISAFFNSLLLSWRAGYMSNFWPAQIYLDASHPQSKITDDWMRGAVISNPAMLHGLFAGTLSFTTNYRPANAATPILWARGMHHHGKCLEFTRARLTAPEVSSEEALNMIHQSTTFSFHCGDLDASCVHRDASKRIIEHLDNGLDSVHPTLKSLLILCDGLMASHMPKRPSLDVASWAPPSWHDEDSLRPLDNLFDFDPATYAAFDQGLFTLREPIFGANEQDFSGPLVDLVNLHREALCANALASSLTVEDGVARADPIYHWLALRQHALTCFTANLYMDMIESETDWYAIPLPQQLQRVFQSCILLATNYTSQLVIRSSMNNVSMGYIPFYHLRNRLSLLMTLMSEARKVPNLATAPASTDALLFLFFAGAAAEEMGAPVPPRSPAQQAGQYGSIPAEATPANMLHIKWFSVHFSMVFQRFGLEDWQDAKAVLQRFVYDERRLDELLQVLVNKRFEFLSVIAPGGRAAAAAAAGGGESSGLAGQGTGPGGFYAGREGSPGPFPISSQVPPFPTAGAGSSAYLGYQGISTSSHQMPEFDALTDQDFAAGFWEHMGLGRTLSPQMPGDMEPEPPV